MLQFQNKKYFGLILFIFFLGLFRGYLSTSGQLFWPDEMRYGYAFRAVASLIEGNILKSIDFLFKADARPGFILWSMLPSIFQHIGLKTGMFAIDMPSISYIPSMLNVCVSLLISLIFFHILFIFTGNKKISLVGVIIYSLLCNTNLYVRHLLPYDVSLLFFMFGLFLIIRDYKIGGLTEKTSCMSGLLSAFAFTIYPAYYLFVVIIFVALVYSANQNKIKMIFLHCLSVIGVIGLWEALAQLSGNSFIANCRILFTALTQEQGNFEEGYIFLFRYMKHVEGIIGYVILGLFFSYLIFILPKKKSIINVIFIVLIGGYLWQGTLGVFFHKMVCYGRIIHMYMPFLVLGAMLTISHIVKSRFQKIALAVLFMISLSSFSSFASEYMNLSYPINFNYEELANVENKNIYFLNEHELNNLTRLTKNAVLVVNSSHFYPIPKAYFPINSRPNRRLIKAVAHPLTFPAYGFEGYSVLERQRIQERKYQMKIFYQTPGI